MRGVGRDRPRRSSRPGQHRNGAGDAALVLGVLAVLLSLLPVVGDLLAVPASVAAVVLATVGYLRAERGEATNIGRALTGGLLGLLGAFVVFLTMAASGGLG